MSPYSVFGNCHRIRPLQRRASPAAGTVRASDSNIALVSDGEFVVNAKAATKNKALLAAVNSGKAPKFSGSSQAAFLTHNAYSPTVNVHVEGGAQDRQLAQRLANHVNDAMNKSAIGFRFSGPQQHASAAASLSRAHSKNA